jgi:hypothetical protein
VRIHVSISACRRPGGRSVAKPLLDAVGQSLLGLARLLDADDAGVVVLVSSRTWSGVTTIWMLLLYIVGERRAALVGKRDKAAVAQRADFGPVFLIVLAALCANRRRRCRRL